MDPSTAVRTDTLPAVATLLAPGALASGAYVWFGAMELPRFAAYLDHHGALSAVLLVLVLITAGMIVESLGSYVEVYAIDRRREDHKKMLKIWWNYLRLAWTHEPVGQRYLRRLMVSFKFELNMFTASLLSVPGVILLWRYGYISVFVFWSLLASTLVVAGLFVVAAKDTAGVLADVRKELAKGAIKGN